jgi:hypothetical protein
MEAWALMFVGVGKQNRGKTEREDRGNRGNRGNLEGNLGQKGSRELDEVP